MLSRRVSSFFKTATAAAGAARAVSTAASHPRYFARHKELASLSPFVLKPGNFVNVTGPRECGKSVLVDRAVIKVLGKDAVQGEPSLAVLDLRVHGFNSVAGFTETVTRCFTGIHHVSISPSLNWIHFGAFQNSLSSHFRI